MAINEKARRRLNAYLDRLLELLGSESKHRSSIERLRGRFVDSFNRYTASSVYSYSHHFATWVRRIKPSVHGHCLLEGEAFHDYFRRAKKTASRGSVRQHAGVLRACLIKLECLTPSAADAFNFVLEVKVRDRKYPRTDHRCLPADFLTRVARLTTDSDPRAVSDLAVITLISESLLLPHQFLGTVLPDGWRQPPLLVEDIIRRPDGSARLPLRSADPGRPDQQAYVSPSTLRVLDRWLRIGNIVAGPLFRNLEAGCACHDATAMAPHQVRRVLLRTAQRLGLHCSTITTHALMRLTALQLVRSGIPVEALTRHLSPKIINAHDAPMAAPFRKSTPHDLLRIYHGMRHPRGMDASQLTLFH